jgi:acyl-CoA thioesterase-1
MDFVVFLFISGYAFFLGMGMAVGAGIVGAIIGTHIVKRVASLLLLIGACVVVLSAAPFSDWAYIVWILLALAHLALLRGREARSAKRSRYPMALLALVAVAAVAAELPHCFAKPIAFPSQGTLYVVGDSLSIGADTFLQNWPEQLGALAGLPTQNLAFGGATLASAHSNAKRIDDDARLVVLEIGGNDLLGGTPVRKFESDLRVLLETVRHDDRDIIMLELPLPPTFNRYGRALRRAAEEYDVQLVPRRILARVITAPHATTDGLHLSHEGHTLLAQTLWSLRK